MMSSTLIRRASVSANFSDVLLPTAGPTSLARNRHGVTGFLFALVLMLGLLLAFSTHAQTTVSGAIAVDTRWNVEGAPYIVNGDVVVQNGAELTIDPGVTVYMEAGAGLTLQAGAVKASGTAAKPIQVLSNKARHGQPAAAGDWKQWTFNPGTVDTRFDHVVFRHGSGLIVKGSAPVFNSVGIHDHQGAAMTVDLAASPSGSGNQASGNTLNGIAVPAGDVTGSVKWAMRGIPYVVASGVVSVGPSPTVESVTPSVVQVGQTATVVLEGTRLVGLGNVRIDKQGVTAQVLAGGSATRASISVVADGSAPMGPAALRLMTDAGEIRIADAITLAQPQPTLASLAPSTIYVGQGMVEVAVNGRGFVADSAVVLGEVTAATTFVSGAQLRARMPAQAAPANLLLKVRTPDPLNAGQFFTSNELPLQVLTAPLAVSPAATTVTRGAVRAITITLPFAAPAGGVSLNLVSSVPSVVAIPSTVLVPEGQNAVSVQLTAAELGDTTITVSRVGMTGAQARVSVTPPPNLTLAPNSLLLGVGRSAELAVTSSVAAPAGGMTVALSSSDPSKASVPATVSIAAGARSAVTTVSTKEIGNATIRAEFPEFVSASAAISVRPVSLNMPAGALVAPGLTRSVPLTLSDPAPAGGLVVTLVSSNQAVASVPATVTVPEGQSNFNFTLSGVAVGTASIGASAANYQATILPVTVDAVQVGFGSPTLSSLSLPEGMKRTVVVTLSRPAPAGGVAVDLVSGDPAKATVSPSSITIGEGETSGGAVMLEVVGVLKGSTTLRANAPGLVSASIPLTVTAKPTLVFNRATVYVGKGLTTYLSELRITRRTDGSAYAPAEPVTVTLSSSDPLKAIVPGGKVTIPAGDSYVNFYVNGLELTDSVTIDASAEEYSAPAANLAVRVITPQFSFVSLDANRSPESIRDNFYIQVSAPGAAYPGDQTATADMPIDLSIVDATVEGIVPGFYSSSSGNTGTTQIVLKRGYSNTNAINGDTYVGVPTAAGTYKIRASVPGVGSNTSAQVNVIAPQLMFSRTTTTVAKGFKTYISEVNVRRVVNGVAFNGADALTVNLTSSDPSRVTVPASVTIPANSASVTFSVTGVELTEGTPVTIDATAAGHAAPAVKLATTVILPSITFVSLETARSIGSERDSFYVGVSVPGAAYPGDQTAVANIPIDLSIADAAPAGIVDGFSSAATGNVPTAQIVLRQGYSDTYSGSGNGYTYINTPTTSGSYKVRAALQGIRTVVSPAIAVTAPDLQFYSGGRTSVTVGKGFDTYSQEIRVRRMAGGSTINNDVATTVTLTSSDPGKVRVPSTVTIPANSATAYFVVTGIELTGSIPVTLTATANGHNSAIDAMRVDVVAPAYSFSSVDLTRSPASARDNFSISATTPGAYYSGSQSATVDILFDLAVVEQDPAGIVEGFYGTATGGSAVTQIRMARGAGSTSTVYVSTPAAAGKYKVQAGVDGNVVATSGIVSVIPPQLTYSRSAIVVGVGLESYYDEIRVYRSVNGTNFSGTAPVTVNLSCTSTVICSVPPSVVIPANQSYTTFKVSGKQVGSTTITATAAGYEQAPDLPVTVITPQLRLSGPSNTKVGAQTNVSVGLAVTGASYSTSQEALSPIAVDLTSSAPGVATVPATLTIAAGSSSSPNGKLTGVAPGSTSVTASAPGLQSVTSATVTISQ